MATHNAEQGRQSSIVQRPRAAAAALGVSISTFWRLVRQSDFPRAVQLGPGSVGFLTEDLSAWAMSRRIERPAAPSAATRTPPRSPGRPRKFAPAAALATPPEKARATWAQIATNSGATKS